MRAEHHKAVRQVTPVVKNNGTKANEGEICNLCTEKGRDARHDLKDCPDYLGCGHCGKQGHYARHCPTTCEKCGATQPQHRHKRTCTVGQNIQNSIKEGKARGHQATSANATGEDAE